MRPQRIIIIRHGESASNVDRTLHGTTPDHKIPLTPKGHDQARGAGHAIWRELYLPSETSPVRPAAVKFHLSPYLRTRQTYAGIVESLKEHGIDNIQTYEDPRLREQEFGNYRPPGAYQDIEFERDTFGTFFYRVPGGESGADVFDRVSGAMDTMHREFEKDSFPDNLIIVSHGLTNRVLLMRWFHWTFEEFESLRNPHNCQFYVLDKNSSGRYQLLTEVSRYTESETREYLARQKRGTTVDLTSTDEHPKDG